jgi:hypothetical protein
MITSTVLEYLQVRIEVFMVDNLQHGHVESKGLYESGCYNKCIPNEIDAPSIDCVCERHEESLTKFANIHEGIDCTECDSAYWQLQSRCSKQGSIDSKMTAQSMS